MTSVNVLATKYSYIRQERTSSRIVTQSVHQFHVEGIQSIFYRLQEIAVYLISDSFTVATCN
jgi:hypothetical protein